jgi:hypothetical protein
MEHVREKAFLFRLVPILAVVAAACGSTPPALILDPGGPFQTTVAATETISQLTTSDVQQLCKDLTTAYGTFLTGGLTAETTCRIAGVEAAASSTDGGTYQEDAGTYQANCQATYETCKQELSDDPIGYLCPLPAANCNATVELLSACLNEIASGEPSQMCIGFSTCNMISEGQPAETQTPPPRLADLPPLPACLRLHQQCPPLDFAYPCGSP